MKSRNTKYVTAKEKREDEERINAAGNRIAAVVLKWHPLKPPAGTGTTIPPPARAEVAEVFNGRTFKCRATANLDLE